MGGRGILGNHLVPRKCSICVFRREDWVGVNKSRNCAEKVHLGGNLLYEVGAGPLHGVVRQATTAIGVALPLPNGYFSQTLARFAAGFRFAYASDLSGRHTLNFEFSRRREFQIEKRHNVLIVSIKRDDFMQ